MFCALLQLTASFDVLDLPAKAKHVRDGIFTWADLLNGQQKLVANQQLTIGGYVVKFKDGEIDVKPLISIS